MTKALTDCVEAQAGLHVCCLQTPEDRVSRSMQPLHVKANTKTLIRGFLASRPNVTQYYSRYKDLDPSLSNCLFFRQNVSEFETSQLI